MTKSEKNFYNLGILINEKKKEFRAKMFVSEIQQDKKFIDKFNYLVSLINEVKK